MRTVALAEISSLIDYGVTASANFEPVGPKFLRITDIQNGVVDWTTVPYCKGKKRKLASSCLKPGDIVFARTGATTGKSFLIRHCPESAVFASYLIRVRPSTTVDSTYLSHFFTSSSYWNQISLKAVGAAQPGVNASKLEELQVPLPSFGQQRRIAAILDQADALRAKRRAALAQLDGIAQVVFAEMFGDLSDIPVQWPTTNVGISLSLPLRNGISPAGDGRVIREVLTLSAITGKSFDASAMKEGRFTSEVPTEKRVSKTDFLICRGNGNPSLVGRGFYPTADMTNTVFPDTMIAARFDLKKFHPKFVQVLWNSKAIRRQIASYARTTNGTFKINQGSLESIVLIMPPLERQRLFAAKLEVLENTVKKMAAHAVHLEALFASLQHRAFRGEL